MVSRQDSVVVDYTKIIRHTDNAMLVDFDGDEVWVPKSQILEHDEYLETLELTSWIARAKGLV